MDRPDIFDRLPADLVGMGVYGQPIEVDGNRIALLGVITGLASAVIATLAVLRRPPWPDIVLRDDLVNIRRRLTRHGHRGSGVGVAGSAR
jgi:hypothetical protein